MWGEHVPTTTPPGELTTTQTWELWLTPHPEAVGEVRRQVRLTLADWKVPDDAVETAELITSELVTNAIRHCDIGHLVHVHITDDGGKLLLEVSDPSRRDPRPVIASSGAEDGRGLLLVHSALCIAGLSLFLPPVVVFADGQCPHTFTHLI